MASLFETLLHGRLNLCHSLFQDRQDDEQKFQFPTFSSTTIFHSPHHHRKNNYDDVVSLKWSSLNLPPLVSNSIIIFDDDLSISFSIFYSLPHFCEHMCYQIQLLNVLVWISEWIVLCKCNGWVNIIKLRFVALSIVSLPSRTEIKQLIYIFIF